MEHNWLAIGDFLSAAVRYRANLGLVRWKASWQSQGSHTQTASDVSPHQYVVLALQGAQGILLMPCNVCFRVCMVKAACANATA